MLAGRMPLAIETASRLMALLLFLAATLLLGLKRLLRHDHRREIVIGLLTLVWAFNVLGVVVLVASLVVAFGANNSFTWHHYQVIFTEGLPAIRDTLIIAAIGMPLGGFYGVLVGYLIARRSFPGRRAMELVAMVNYALPGTIVGIAYLIAFNDPPLALSGGALIIIACYVFRYSPTGIRATVALLQQIDRSIEEASSSLGAGSGETFRRVTLPLIAPAFFAGLAAFVSSPFAHVAGTVPRLAASGDIAHHQEAIVRSLERKGIRTGYSDFSIAAPVTMFTSERIVLSPALGPTPAYESEAQARRVAEDGPDAYVLPPEDDPERFASVLRGLGVGFQMETKPVIVFYGFSRRVGLAEVAGFRGPGSERGNPPDE
jgi:ABC-type spermidine/putrescine transport system permease subunit II